VEVSKTSVPKAKLDMNVFISWTGCTVTLGMY